MIYIYLIYFFSGLIKVIFLFYGIELPFDITLLSGILLLLFLSIDFYKYKIRKYYSKYTLLSVALIFIFYAWMIITLLYTPSQNYSKIKTILFTTNIIAFIIPLLANKFDIRRFIQAFILITIIFSIWFLITYYRVKYGTYLPASYNIIRGTYLSLSSLAGIGVIVLLNSNARIYRNKITDKMTAFFLLIIIFILGGRGPLLFVFFVLFLKYLRYLLTKKFSFKININRLFFFLFVLFPVSVFVFGLIIYKFHDQIDTLIHRSVVRLSLLFEGIENKSNLGDSVNTRLGLYNFAISSIFGDVKIFLSGSGIGSFGILESGVDGRLYPHNIILEIWFELGLVGLIIFIFYLIILFSFNTKKTDIVSIFVIVFILLNMMKSSSIIDIRNYFTFFAFYILQNNVNNTKSVNSNGK